MLKFWNVLGLLVFCLMTACEDTGNKVTGWMSDSINRASMTTASLNLSVVEGGSHSLLITLDNPIREAADLTWTINAPVGQFVRNSGTVHFPKGSQSGLLQIDTINNSVHDGNRTYQLQLSGGFTIFSNTLTIAFTIIDEDNFLPKTWDFTDNSLSVADFGFDPRYLTFSASNGIQLKTVNTLFDSASTFGLGAHIGTAYSGGKLSLSTSFQNELASSWTPEWSSLSWYWKMNGTGTMPLSAVGVDVGGTTCSTSASTSTYVPGKLNNGLARYKQNSTIDCSVPTLTTMKDEITVAGWIKHLDGTAFPSAALLTTNSISSNAGFSIQRNGSDEVYVRMDTNAQNNIVCGTTTALDGKWHYIAFSANRGRMKVYLDGELTGTCDYTHGNGFAPPTNTVSFSGFSEDALTTIDDWAVWGKELTAGQIKSIYFRQAQNYSTELSPAWTPSYSSLIGYWKMDSTWTDGSGKGNHATATGTTAFDTTDMKVGGGSSVFTALGRAQVSGLGTSMGTSRSFSIAFWMKPNAPAQWSGPVSFGDGYLRFEHSAVGQLTVSNSGLQSTTVFCSSCITDKVWQHLTFTADGTTWRIFVDGVVKSHGTITGDPTFGPDLFMGARNNSINPWKGYLDDVAVWKGHGLSVAEVLLIYNRQKQKYAGTYDSPVIDLGASGNWSSLTPTASLPFGKQLTATGQNESGSAYSGITGTLVNNLLAYWKMDETSGTLQNSSGTTLNLSTTNSPTLNAPGLHNAGVGISRASTQYLTSPSIDVGNQFTLSIWAKHKDTTQYWQTLFSTKGCGNNFSGYSLGINKWDTNNGRVIFESSNGTTASNAQTADGATSVGKWNHYVVVVNRTTGIARIWVNGVDKTSAQIIMTDFPTAGALNLGAMHNSCLGYFDGTLDEAAIWTRNLSAQEILELYRRGANRIKYQVRSCSDETCSSSPWIGPGGSSTTYFSELHNNSLVSSTGYPTGNVNASSLSLDWTTPLFTNAAKPADNRYFQYRVYMESDDQSTLCNAGSCMPELTSVAVGPAGRYYGGSPSIMNKNAQSFTHLQSMTRGDSGSCTTYQVSIDGGLTWKWWDASINSGAGANAGAWATASSSAQSNYLSDYSQPRLSTLTAGNFKFRTFLNSNASLSQSCTLDRVEITYDP